MNQATATPIEERPTRQQVEKAIQDGGTICAGFNPKNLRDETDIGAGIGAEFKRLHSMIQALCPPENKWVSVRYSFFGEDASSLYSMWSAKIGSHNVKETESLPSLLKSIREFDPETEKAKRIASLRAELAALEAEGGAK